jgi:hypothetical protein
MIGKNWAFVHRDLGTVEDMQKLFSDLDSAD